MARQLWACARCLDGVEVYGADGDFRLPAGLYETEAEALACEARHDEAHRQEQERARERHAEAIAEGKRQAAADQAMLKATEAETASPIGDAVLPADWLTMPVEELEAAVTRNVGEVERRRGDRP